MGDPGSVGVRYGWCKMCELAFQLPEGLSLVRECKEVLSELRGGMGSDTNVVERLRTRGLRVVPECPYCGAAPYQLVTWGERRTWWEYGLPSVPEDCHRYPVPDIFRPWLKDLG